MLFCKAFLQERSFRVRVGATLSNPRRTDMGIPQGSIIAPVMFNIMMYDIHTVPLKNAQTVLYADDLTLWANENYKDLKSNYVVKVVRNRFQKNVDLIIAYMKDNGFELAADKTVFMIFNRSKYNKDDLYININNRRIVCSSQVKFLGLIIDAKLTWKEHIKHLITKTNSVWNIIKILKSTEGARHKKNIIQIIGALVRSRMSYGQEAFYAANRSTLTKLQTRECKFLRYALDIPNNSPQEVIYREVGWLPLELNRKLQVTQYVMRANIVENSTNQELDDDFDNRYDPALSARKRTPRIDAQTESIGNYITDLCQKAELSRKQIVRVPDYSFPPWLMEEATITWNLGPITKNSHPLLVGIVAQEKNFHQFRDTFQICTDGSKLENGHVGCAFYIPHNDVTKHFRLNNGLSIFSAELYAILMALLYVADFQNIPSDVVILTDSRSALQSLHYPKKNRKDLAIKIQTIVHQLSNKDCHVSMQWIPSHTGIYGNERADRAAKSGANLSDVTNDIGLTLSEATSKLKQAITVIWRDQYRELAEQKDWVERDISRKGTFPNLPKQLLPLFYRLRAKTFKAKFTAQNCSCGQLLTFTHIFTCDSICQMPSLQVFSRNNNVILSRQNLLTKHSALGWTVVVTFLRELLRSNIGHLI